MTEPQLIKLIDLYFDGSATTEQERMLRQGLADSDSTDPRIAEARAVMAYAAMAARREGRLPHPAPHRRMWPRAVAAVAVAAALWLALVRMAPASADPCSTYMACAETSDPEVALGLMEAQLSAVADASQAVGTDISIEFDAISNCLNNL